MAWLMGAALAWGACSQSQPGDPDGGPDGADGADGADAGQESATDGGDGFTGEIWPWCPEASAYVGGDWTWAFRVTPEALYCGSFDEQRTLVEELARKAQLRIVPGRFPVPQSSGTVAFLLPTCLRFQEGDEPPLLDGAGEMIATHTPWQGGDGFAFSLRQPLRTETGEGWVVEMMVNDWTQEAVHEVPLAGAYVASFEAGQSFRLCQTSCESWEDNRWFASCRFDDAELQRHTVVFTGGQAELDVRMGVSAASTEPALFVEARGALDGTPFEQRDYWKLVYNPTHHHFTRDFAVLFDQPITGACGLKFTDLDPYLEPPPGRVALVRCDLGEIEPREVLSESFDRP